jgi:HSP20 family protein
MWYRTRPFLAAQSPENLLPWASLDELRRRMDRVFDDVSRSDAEAVDRSAAHVFEDTGTSLVLRADLPGVTEKDLTVTLQRNVLGLTVRRSLERPEGFRPHRQERSSFERTWTLPLPARVDPEKVTATLADGELTVTLAKASEDQPRNVAVQVA